MKARTSQSHPLQIATIEVPGATGAVGITFCPGKKDPDAATGAWDRDLRLDVEAISAWSAAAVVCLMETHELKLLKVPRLAGAIGAAKLAWFHLPIRDVSVPEPAFETAWAEAGPKLRDLLADGRRVLVHCRGGLGRSGMIAARLLVELGMKPDAAIALVRKRRPGAIETKAQQAYVRQQVPVVAGKRWPVTDGDALDRALGCLVGLAIGDALGTTLEFKPRDTYQPITGIVGGGPFNLKPGEWTDDTSMALCLADSLLHCGRLDPADLVERFRRWRDEGHNSVNGRCFDIGITTSQAIGRYAATGQPLAGATDPKTAGNGSIMRLAPVPIFHQRDPKAAEAAAIAQSRTTHAAPECLESCRLMTRILISLLDGVPWAVATVVEPGQFQRPKVRALARGAWRGKNRAQIRSSGYVIDTLEAALWAVDTAPDARQALLLAVNLGGDADTVGAVAGQLAGVRHGLSAIPAEWRATLAWADRIEAVARALHDGRPAVALRKQPIAQARTSHRRTSAP